jgi:hypothetical protein
MPEKGPQILPVNRLTGQSLAESAQGADYALVYIYIYIYIYRRDMANCAFSIHHCKVPASCQNWQDSFSFKKLNPL